MVAGKDITRHFARVNKDSYEEYGIKSGDLVYIVGSGFAPVDEHDNYKLLFVVVTTTDDVPSGERGITIGRESLDICSDDEQVDFNLKMEAALEREEAATTK